MTIKRVNEIAEINNISCKPRLRRWDWIGEREKMTA